ncbi:MAG: PorP/SprF family type IX secretion system membrane protein [Flavobacteriia bacterium]|nr:PorP/SprF family type IX secretion system membrane protein [Flavobacteriia bacterium]
MKKFLLSITTILACSSQMINAQQEKLLTHFIYDKMTINPGSTGMNDGITGTIIYRNQWDKINGAPNSVLFNVDANVNRYLPVNLGLSFYHDAIGHMRQNNVLLNVSFPWQLGGGRELGIGLGLGMVNVGFNGDWIPSGGDYTDPLLPASGGGVNLDVNLGLFYKTLNKFYAGLSMTHLSGAELKNINYNNARNLFVLVGKGLNLDDQGVKRIDIQMLMRTEFVKFSTELNARFFYNSLYAGATYRLSDGLGVMLGYDSGKIGIGYSYDLTLNKLRTISKGSHEFFLKYRYIIPEPPVQKSKHPRWL